MYECKNGNHYFYNEFKQFHREDGPAVILKTGDTFYYFNGIPYEFKDWILKIRKNVFVNLWNMFLHTIKKD